MFVGRKSSSGTEKRSLLMAMTCSFEACAALGHIVSQESEFD